jgi:hypothetical protein
MRAPKSEPPFPGFPGSEEEIRRWKELAPDYMPALPPGLGRSLLLYLDQKVWVDLLRGAGSAIEQSGRLLEAVDQGSLAVALSSAHYVETWHRGDWASRWALARLMWNMTRLTVLPPMDWLIRREVADAMRLFDIDAPGALEGHVPIGQGVDFAFDSPTGRLVHVDDRGDRVPWSELPEVVRSLHATGATYEWFSLAGMPYDMSADGLDLMTNRQTGLQFAQYESDFARTLGKRRGAARGRPLIVDAMRAIEGEIVAVCQSSHVPPRSFLLWLLDGDQRRARAFVEGMTSYGTLQRLRILRHENRQKQWEGNDRVDLLALSVALTSCDVVVTERQWVHLARRAGFTGDGTARVYHSLDSALDEVL